MRFNPSTIKQIPKRIIQTIKSESRRLFFFGLIGFGSLGLNIGLYALLSRILWPDGNRTLEYLIVVIIVSVVNFEANCHYTFASHRSLGALMRSGLVVIAASILNTVLFWMGHAIFHLYDLAVIVVNTFLVAIFTYSSHRFFTFHSDPWRILRQHKSEG
ncbi:MAG: GtrA family protein [Patescibacteria group bacterium]